MDEQPRVRAKFRLNSYTTELHNRCVNYNAPREEPRKYEQVEKRTLNFTPVFPQGDNPNPEDVKFWDASPSGALQLGVVNQAAWDRFKLGRSYYLDFTEAEE